MLLHKYIKTLLASLHVRIKSISLILVITDMTVAFTKNLILSSLVDLPFDDAPEVISVGIRIKRTRRQRVFCEMIVKINRLRRPSNI